ncbi:hypothetical protein [Humibacter soli]
MSIATGVAVVALACGGALATSAPAQAAGEGALTVTKSVSNPTPAPGDEFTFSMRVGCDDNDCINASLTDQLPSQFDGFPIISYSVTPGTSGVEWNDQITGCTNNTVTDSCAATVNFISALGEGGVGLPAGQAYTLTVTLKVPQDLSPSWPYNGQSITNTASTTADNAAPQTSTAGVTITVPVTVDTAVTKNWTPTSEQFAPGAQSTIDLTTQNTSNVPADSLVLQEPAAAPDGAATLDPSNPFLYTDFAGLGDITLPDGADQVQVDAYVFDPVSGTYSWVNGDPGPPPAALPGGVQNGDVAGIRVTFTSSTGTQITPGGSAGAVPIDVTQRATNRDTDASLEDGWTATNAASSTVNVPGQAPVSKDATADHAVTPINIVVQAGKSFDPENIPAGVQSIGTVTAQNKSDGTLDQLTISDQDYFTRLLPFDGFTAPIVFPASSTSATITWTYSDGSTSSEAFTSASGNPPQPAPPAGQVVTGFEIAFDGPIDQNATASASFGVTPSLAYVTEATSPRTSTNTVDVTGTAGGKTNSDQDTAQLNVYDPDISLALQKIIVPDAAESPVEPGGTVTVELPATTGTDSAFVTPTSITVTDVAPTPHDDSSFWNAFNPIEIAPTQVPAGATLSISYTTDDGATWQTADWCGLPVTGVTVYSCDIPSNLQGTITGLQFDFTDPAGFPQGTTVQPNMTFAARSDQRYSGDPTSVPDAGPSVYGNTATAQGEGQAGGQTITSDPVDGSDNAAIETNSGENGSLIAGKRWTTPDFSGDLTQVASQSGQQAGTVLDWGVTTTGYASLTVSDGAVGPAGNPAPAQATTYQAFDLTQIAPITTAQDSLLQWDTVSQIRLYENGGWVVIAPPGGSWMNGTGFVGYTLTPAERAATTGMQITVVPNDAARSGSTDPTRPQPGSGISSSSVARHFNLVWTLRNTLRVPDSDGTWVNGSTLYNTSTEGLVRNHEQVDAVLQAGGTQTSGADDTILILDQPPGVSVVKSTQKDTIALPHPGDVPPSSYPTNDFTITANSTSSSRASYVRVTDPMPCAQNQVSSCASDPSAWAADPFAGYTYDASNPFDAFTLTGLTFTYDAAEVDPNASVVTLLHRSAGGVLTTSTTTITGAQAMTEADLQDVVGVSVTYQGTDPATTGGTITSGDKLAMVMHTRVRVSLRSDPIIFVTPETVSNFAFAQSYDPVLYPSADQAGSTPIDSSNAQVKLVQGQLDITASKSIDPQSVLEANRTDPVTVTLGAAQGPDATVPTNQVTIEDSDQGFWNDFQLTSLSAADVTLPAGADQVEVDVQLNGSTTWTTGTSGATAALPAGVNPADVTGIRFVFDRADGGLFSNTAPPQAFSASAVLHVQLRDTARDGTDIPFPGTVNDTATATTHRTDGTSDLYPDDTAQAESDLALQPGTFDLDVAKDPFQDRHTVSPGSSVPWTLTFTNTGTGILTVPALVDTLPQYLRWDGADPTYVDSDGGTLSTAVTLTDDRQAGTLTFAWPEDGRRMQPGEQFTITIGLILQPGLNENESTTNQMVVQTDEDLASCTNTSGNGQGVVGGLPDNECGTTNFVQPIPGPALLATKGVRGDVVDPLVSGAQNPLNPNANCQPVNGYYYAPCVANTRMGGTDEWLLTVTNSGTVPYSSVTMVDPLPTPGDKLLSTGAARGSTWKAVFDVAYGVQVSAPLGSTQTIEVSTDSNLCVGTGTPTQWSTDPTCSSNTWTALDAYAGDPVDITGFRVVVTLPANRPLGPGGTITATARTIDQPVSSADPQGMTTAVPQPSLFDYNQSGVQATLSNNAAPLAQAPVKVGVTPLTGSLQVVKKITGDDAERAPSSFDAGVSCAAADAQLDLGDAATLTLDSGDSYTARVDGIPIGASCDVSENGDPGSYGEDSRTIAPGTVGILEPSSSDGPVPDAQIVTITNEYDPVPPTPTPTPTPTTPGPTSGSSNGGGLAGTGSDAVTPLLAGLGILLAGGGLLALIRWRRRHV